MSALEQLLKHPRFGPAGVNERMAAFTQGLNMVPAIKIVGSNGKGTTAHLMAQMAMGLGKSVGLYTSPHLLQINERIQANGQIITDIDLETSLAQALDIAKNTPQAGRFEILTLAALVYFMERNVDIAIMEIGLGGRFDPVRIAPGHVAVLTSLDLEHTAILGDSLDAIATEKTAVCKKGDILLSAVAGIETCLPCGVEYVDLSHPPLSPLQSNARLAAHALKIHFGLKDLPETFGIKVPARLQKISQDPPLYIDVAHTAKAIETVLDHFKDRPVSLICAFKNDKDICRIDHPFHHVVALQPDETMHSCADILKHLKARYQDCATDIGQALDLAKGALPDNGVIIALGGFGIAGRMLAHMQGTHYDVISL